jgi:3',5'-cyclic AMP phosphodiesterase CpdA
MKRRFLHFSDIHFGQEKNGTLEIHEDVRFEVLSDCRTVLNNGLVDGPIDAILLTGDIAQQGKEAEFKRAVDWLDALTTIVKCDRTNVRTKTNMLIPC